MHAKAVYLKPKLVLLLMRGLCGVCYVYIYNLTSNLTTHLTLSLIIAMLSMPLYNTPKVFEGWDNHWRTETRDLNKLTAPI